MFLTRRFWTPPIPAKPCTCNMSVIDNPASVADDNKYASSCTSGNVGPGDSCNVMCAMVGQDGIDNNVPATCGLDGKYADSIRRQLKYP